jgi:hypothetical protein
MHSPADGTLRGVGSLVKRQTAISQGDRKVVSPGAASLDVIRAG